MKRLQFQKTWNKVSASFPKSAAILVLIVILYKKEFAGRRQLKKFQFFVQSLLN